jgi:hypothetical protein
LEIKMALYKLSPKYKKSAIEVASWEKDGVTIVYREGYRGGTFYCESDTRPDISLEDNEQLYIWDADCGTADCWEMEELWDGCWGGWEFPDDMPQEEQDRIEALWEEDSYTAMEEDGWYHSDTEYYFEGPLTMTCDGVELDSEDESDEPKPVLLPSVAWPFPSAAPPTDDETKRDENGVVIQSGGKPVWPF